MSTRRAKQHKRDVFFKVRARRRWKKFEDGLYIKIFKQSLMGVIKNPGLLAYVERTYEDD